MTAMKASAKSVANQYSYLLNNDKIGILRCRIGDGLLLSASEGLLTMFGYNQDDEIVGKLSSLTHYVDPADRERMLTSAVDNVIAGYDLRVKKADGTLFWVSLSARIYPELGYYEGVVVDITARQALENDLREAEAAHGRLFENTHAIMMLIDPESGAIVEANPAAADFYGYPREILTKMNLDAISVLPREEMLQKLSQADEMGTVSNYRHRLASGEIRDIESRRGLVTINGRQLVYVINNDISERITAEINRERELLKFRVLYDLALAITDENSLEANLKLVADKTRELLGVDLAFIALRDEEKQDVHIHTLSGHISTEIETLRLSFGIGHGGLVAQMNQGIIIEDYASSQEISHEKDAAAQAEGMVSGMAVPLQMGKKNLGVLYAYNRHKTKFYPQDLETLTLIGNLAAGEVSRKMSDAALTASQQQMADIIDFLPDPTLVIDREGKVLAWNRAIEEMTGVPASEVVGKGNHEHAIPFYGERRPILIDLVIAQDPGVEKDYFFIRRDKEALVAETPTPRVKGKRLFLWGKATPLYNPQGELVGAIESIRDITERRENEEALQKSYQQLERILAGVVNALGATAEKRDPYTAGHQRRVSQLAVSIAKLMNLPDKQIDAIQTASALHDIGKMYIPAEILSKPGQLTQVERMLIETHPQAGYDIVKTIPFADPIADILIQHHERLDGSGYPRGLSGSQILLEARIIAVADVVEAMSSHRPYRPSFGLETALQEIIRYKGRLYDPEVVEACISIFRERDFNFS